MGGGCGEIWLSARRCWLVVIHVNELGAQDMDTREEPSPLCNAKRMMGVNTQTLFTKRLPVAICAAASVASRGGR